MVEIKSSITGSGRLDDESVQVLAKIFYDGIEKARTFPGDTLRICKKVIELAEEKDRLNKMALAPVIQELNRKMEMRQIFENMMEEY